MIAGVRVAPPAGDGWQTVYLQDQAGMRLVGFLHENRAPGLSPLRFTVRGRHDRRFAESFASSVDAVEFLIAATGFVP